MDVRIVESLAMLAIGDGVLAALFPVEHCARWEAGPWAPMMGWFRQRPGLTRAVGVAGRWGSSSGAQFIEVPGAGLAEVNPGLRCVRSRLRSSAPSYAKYRAARPSQVQPSGSAGC